MNRKIACRVGVLTVFPTAHKTRKSIGKPLLKPKKQYKSSSTQKFQIHFISYARQNILRQLKSFELNNERTPAIQQ